MPAALFAKYSRNATHRRKLERLWNQSKDIVRDQYGSVVGRYGVVMTVFKNKARKHAGVRIGEDGTALEKLARGLVERSEAGQGAERHAENRRDVAKLLSRLRDRLESPDALLPPATDGKGGWLGLSDEVVTMAAHVVEAMARFDAVLIRVDREVERVARSKSWWR